MPTLHPLRLSALIVATLLLLGVFLNQSLSGRMEVRGVTVENRAPQEKEKNLPKLVVTLPMSLPDQTKGGVVHVHVPYHISWWEQLFDTYLMTTNNCIFSVEIDEKPFTSAPSQNSICPSYVKLDAVASNIGLQLQNAQGNVFDLALVRGPLLSQNAARGLVFFACYLLFLAAHNTVRQALHSHMVLIICGIFLGTTWVFLANGGAPPPHTRNWYGSLLFYSSGPAVFGLMLLGWFWHPLHNTHLAANEILSRVGRIPPHYWAISCALAFLLLASILSHVLFGTLPHVADTHAQYVMAKMFAQGHVTEPSHPLRKFFDFQFMINDGKYYGQYFPGHAVLLALGMLVQLPWIINPLFGALTVYMSYLLARELTDEKTGMLAAFLMLISPHVVFMSSEYMSHTTCMFFLTAFIYCYTRLLNTNHLRYALLAGLCLGIACTIRLQIAVPCAVPIGIHALVRLVKSPRALWRPSLAMGMGCLLFLLLLMHYNTLTTGHPLVPGYAKTYPHAANFTSEFLNPKRWLLLQGDIRRGVLQIAGLHTDMMGWPASPFIFILVLFLARHQPPYANLLLATIFAAFLSLVFVNPWSNSVSPSRYVYEVTSLLIVLIAIGITRLPQIIEAYVGKPLPTVASATALTITIFVLAAWPARVHDLYRTYANNFWEGNANYHHTIVDSVEKPALVFMQNYPEYRLNFFTQPPYDSNPVIFAQDLKEKNKLLMDFYPGRHAYHVDKWNIRKLR